MRPEGSPPPNCTVAVVGGGTAGLALAAALARLGVPDVLVLERERHAGGVPRHCGHYPFGLKEYGFPMRGIDYARRNVNAAIDLGVRLHTGVTVTALHPDGELSLATPAGLARVRAQRVVLCTGVRESSRAQRFIGGDRPLGVVTTGSLQAMVYLEGIRPFRRPVILGSELVSFSAVETCRHLSIRPVAMVEELHRLVARNIFRPYLTLRGIPLYLSAGSPRILGDQEVSAIEFDDGNGGRVTVETDGVIVSGRFRCESALVRASHLRWDPGTGGPVIDQFGRCSDPSYYSAGNLLRPAESSAWCWREGVETARWIADDLAGNVSEGEGSIRLDPVDPDIQFVVPQRLTATSNPGGVNKLQVGLRAPVKGRMQASIDGKPIWEARIRSRPVRRTLLPLPASLKAHAGKTIQLSIHREN